MSAAPAKLKLPNDRTIEIPSRQMVKVLLIDDDHDFRHRMKNFLESKGCSVRVASTLDDAKSLLKPNTYQMIIADIWFRASNVTGDKFITDNIGLMKDAKVVAITAQGINTIPNLHELDQLGVEVYEKGHFQFAESIKSLAAGAFKKRVDDISSDVEKAVSCIVEGAEAAEEAYPRTYHVVLAELVETLSVWFTSRKGSTKPVLVYQGRQICCDELAGEAKKGTPLGVEFMRILVRNFRQDLMKKGKDETTSHEKAVEAEQPAAIKEIGSEASNETTAASASHATVDN